MIHHRLLFNAVVLLASPALMLAQTTTHQPADSSTPTIEMPQFTVSTDQANPYRATDSLSAARIRGALIDTPATINVITRDFLNDVGANSIFDATQYVAGIGNGRLAGANGILDRQTIRGFENNGRTIDNFATSFQANINPELIERIEIVKGPNAILAPTGAPGGSINIITKAPQITPENSVAVEVGSYFSEKLTVDSTGPLSLVKGLAYRFVGSYQNTNTFQPGRLKQWDVNPEFSYQFSETSKITLKLNHIDWVAKGAAFSPGNTLIAGPEVANGGTVSSSALPAGFSYKDHGGIPDWSERSDRVSRIAVELTSALTDRINMRLAGTATYDYFNQDGATLAFLNGGGSYYNPYTGIYTPNYKWAKDSTGTYVSTYSAEYDPTNVPLTGSISRTWAEDFIVQNDFAGNFEAGPVSLQPVAGWLVEHAPQTNLSKSISLPNVNLYVQNNNPAKPNYSSYSNSSLNGATLNKDQAYAFLRTGFFHDRVLLTTGASRVWIDSINTNELNWSSSELKGHYDTYLGGFLVKATKNISGYYSYSTNANATTFNNQPLWQTGKQHEFGVKTEFFDQRLAFSAAHFQIAQTNLVTPNPVYLTVPGAPQYFLSDQTNRGYEFEVIGGITKDLSVIASYTAMHLRDPIGRRVRNIPDTMANALLNYHFRQGTLKGANVFVGVTHVGNQAGENPSASYTALGVIEQVSFFAPARTIYNAGASYTWDRYSFNLNVDNVFDTQTIWQSSGRFSMSPYPTTNVRLTTRIKF